MQQGMIGASVSRMTISSKSRFSIATAFILSITLSACGGGGSSKNNAPYLSAEPVLFDAEGHATDAALDSDELEALNTDELKAARQQQCPSGGDFVESGFDNNRNDLLDSGEVNAISYFCAGDQSFSFSAQALSVSESVLIDEVVSDNALELIFSLTNGPQSSVSFDYATSSTSLPGEAVAGEDYTSVSGSVVFERGEKSKTIVVPILNDALSEGHETFDLLITNTVNTNQGNLNLTIKDDDNPKVEFEAVSTLLTETHRMASTVNIKVILSNALDVDVAIPYQLSSDVSTSSATKSDMPLADVDDDFTVSPEPGASIVFPAGSTEQVITLSVLDDAISEGRELVNLELMLIDEVSEGGQMNHSVFIVDAGASLSANHRHNCVLSEDQGVKCWGNNIRGQLGINSPYSMGLYASSMGEALPMVDTNPVQELATGYLHTCARLLDNSLRCWGYSNSGQLGYDQFDSIGDVQDLTSAGVVPAHTLVNSDLAAVNLGEGQAVRHIAAGQIHTCAILTDGAVKCWGDNSKGQLGLGDRDNRGDGLVANPQYSAEANPVDDPRDSENNLINCSVISKPLFPIECAGISSEMGDDLPLVALGVGVSAEALALGAKHSCVLTTAGELKCWGDNTYGQLGLGDTEHRGDEVIVELVDGETVTRSEMGDNLPVVQVSDELGVTIVQAVAGERHTCVLLTNTQVKCWGDNHYGQLGLGSQLGQLVPGASVDLGSGFVPVKLFAGAFHNCALSALGSVKCWGRNSAGQLGYEDLDARGDGRIPNPDFGAEEAADDAYCSSVDNSTTEAYFDESACPELAEMGDNLLSLTFPAGRSVIDLALGGLHSCAILDNTQIKCWGDAEHGQLGQEDKQDMSDGTILNPVYDAEIELVEGEELTACHVTLEYVASSCGIAELADETLSTEVF